MKFRLVAFAMVAFACLFAIAEPVNAREPAIPKPIAATLFQWTQAGWEVVKP